MSLQGVYGLKIWEPDRLRSKRQRQPVWILYRDICLDENWCTGKTAKNHMADYFSDEVKKELISAVKTSHRTALKENNKPYPRSVHRTKAFRRMYKSLHGISLLFYFAWTHALSACTNHSVGDGALDVPFGECQGFALSQFCVDVPCCKCYAVKHFETIRRMLCG